MKKKESQEEKAYTCKKTLKMKGVKTYAFLLGTKYKEAPGTESSKYKTLVDEQKQNHEITFSFFKTHFLQ